MFPLADVLSVTTPKLLSRCQMDGLTDLLNWMTGDQLQMWQLQRAADECAPALLKQHPVLEGVTPPEALTGADLYAWLVRAEAQYGEEVSVRPLAQWTHQDPVQEFIDRAELARLPVVTDERMTP
jgi:hypothetical protein